MILSATISFAMYANGLGLIKAQALNSLQGAKHARPVLRVLVAQSDGQTLAPVSGLRIYECFLHIYINMCVYK